MPFTTSPSNVLDRLKKIILDRAQAFMRFSKLRQFFRRKYRGVECVDIRDGSIMLYLRVSNLQGLKKLYTEVSSQKSAVTETIVKHLSDVLGWNLEENFTLTLAIDKTKYEKAKVKLDKTEEEDYPSEPESLESDNEEDERKPFERFLSKVRLENMFPCRLTLQKFQLIKCNVDYGSFVDSFWQKLTALDFRAGLPQHLLSNPISMRDFIFAILHCADPFLRQDIIEKMSTCQLAVPIVLPGVGEVCSQILLWGFRRIIKKWWGKVEQYPLEQIVIKYPIFVVSVVRIGNVQISKSQLLNTMLGLNQGNTFHYFFLCKEKDVVKPSFSFGSIECAWYLPTNGYGNENLESVTAFLNLRGDCEIYPEQTSFACKAANLVIALISTEGRKFHRDIIRKISDMAPKVLFISVKDDNKCTGNFLTIHRPILKGNWLFVKVLQMEIIGEFVCKRVNDITKSVNEKELCSLENVILNYGYKFFEIDESIYQSCKKARTAIENLFQLESVENVNELKEKCFPLQKVWKKWVQEDRVDYSFENEGEESFEHHNERRSKARRKHRESQVETGLSLTMKSYLNEIKNARDDPQYLHFLLGFLQDHIYHIVNNYPQNQENLFQISQLKKQLHKHSAAKPFGSAQSDSEEGRSDDRYLPEVNRSLSKYNALQETFHVNNLGCEHFLRELGQLFEAHAELGLPQSNGKESDYKIEISTLPDLAAFLVKEAHSLEIMDGDTGVVPLRWITSILNKLRCDLQDPKVLVISVIGVQSSGKSTLLNSMFGLRFPVRAGRCTRGLFVRLLKLEENFAYNLGFSYLIVVDTEGIRSIDQDNRKFDNELVTLALSIANVTIFNIEGENIGPDMTGILQIAAHALMRMKEVDIECHCRIVQQRVSDLTAGSRNKENTKRIFETLDEATKFAAEEEGLERRYQHFSDVVDLQVDDQLQYIPCLWIGGMSPPNHMYSEMIAKVREKLFQDVKEKKIITELTLSSFTERVVDVCKAVKEEGFIFNFQDSVKAVDFNQFCLLYNQWIADMRKKIMFYNEEALDEMQYEREEFGSYTSYLDDVKDELHETIERERKSLVRLISDYITTHPRRNTVAIHKKGFLGDVNIVLKDVENHAVATLEDEYTLMNVRKNLPKFRSQWRSKLALKAKEVAIYLRKSPSSEPEHSFEIHWKEWMRDIDKEIKQSSLVIPTSSLKKICENLLLKITRDISVGSEIRSLMTQEGGIDKHSTLNNFERYIHEKFVKASLPQAKHDTTAAAASTEKIQEEKEKMVQFCINVLKNQLGARYDYWYDDYYGDHEDTCFNPNSFQLIIQSTLNKLCSKTAPFRLPGSLVAKGLLYVSCKLLERYIQLQDWQENECSSFLLQERQMLLQDFLCFFTNKSRHLRAAEFTYYYLESHYVDLARNECKELSKSNTCAKYINRMVMPWDKLRNSVVSNSRMPDGYDFNLNYERSLNIYFYDDFFHNQRQKYELQIKNEGNARNDAHVRNLFECLERLEIVSSKSAPSDWAEKLSEYVGSPYIENVQELYGNPDFVDVSNCLKSLIETKLRPRLRLEVETIHLNFDWISFKTALGVSNLCSHVCPMCGVSCDCQLTNHTTHYALLHRPRGFSGAKYPGKLNLVLEDCVVSILSKTATLVHKGSFFFCHKYKDIFPDWEIALTDSPGNLFWKWVMVKKNTELANIHGCLPANVPPSWKSITPEAALNSLLIDQKLKTVGRLEATMSNISVINTAYPYYFY